LFDSEIAVTQRPSFAKLQRDRDKQAKAAAKRQKRQERDTATDTEADLPALDETTGELSAAELLKHVEAIHRRFEAGEIEFEAFEESKAAILSRLPID
jgi:hypothetical protein